MAQVGFADPEALRQLTDPDRLVVVVVDVRQHILDHAVGNLRPLHCFRTAHSLADQVHGIHKPGIILKA